MILLVAKGVTDKTGKKTKFYSSDEKLKKPEHSIFLLNLAGR